MTGEHIGCVRRVQRGTLSQKGMRASRASIVKWMRCSREAYRLTLGQLPSPRSRGAMMNLKPSGRRASSSVLPNSSPAASGSLLIVCFVG